MSDKTNQFLHLCRFGLVRVRENAESIAFYGGEASEARLLFQRLADVVANYGQLLVTSRNLSFFTSFYRRALLHLMQTLFQALARPSCSRTYLSSLSVPCNAVTHFCDATVITQVSAPFHGILNVL